MSIAQGFLDHLGSGSAPDASQRAAADRLDVLVRELKAKRAWQGTLTWLNRWWRKHPTNPIRGVYLWGGVGRGKTVLVDLLAREMGERVCRSHFHRFMQDVHHRLQSLRSDAHANPIAEVARTFAEEVDLLCFDELYVHDIADAMILGGLFEALIGCGVTLVFTSNAPPSGLYKDGLQRNRFLPTIALLERVTDSVEVDAGIDYRLRLLQQAPMYTLADETAEAFLSARFNDLSNGAETSESQMDIEGRPVAVRRRRGGVVWFDFAALCQGPRGTDDYISVACQFHTVILSRVPVMTLDDNAARRFIALVDEFYERGVKLVLSTASSIENLYAGERLEFDYRRTVSRLTEMQSTAYLGLPHRP